MIFFLNNSESNVCFSVIYVLTCVQNKYIILNFVQFTDEFNHMFLSLIFIFYNIKNTLIHKNFPYCL